MYLSSEIIHVTCTDVSGAPDAALKSIYTDKEENTWLRNVVPNQNVRRKISETSYLHSHRHVNFVFQNGVLSGSMEK
jgi:hypothetical protein